MMENLEKLKEKIISEFIIGTCQLLPKPRDTLSEPVHFRNGYGIHCGSTGEFYIRPLHSCVNDVDELMVSGTSLAFAEDIPVMPNDVSHLQDTIECYRIEHSRRYPGFVRLRHFGQMNYIWKRKIYEFSHTTCKNHYITIEIAATAARQQTLESIPATKYTANGPALTIDTNSKNPSNANVKSVRYYQLLKEAQSWSKDHTLQTTDTTSVLVQHDYRIVYVRDPAFRDDDKDYGGYDSVTSMWCPQWPKEALYWSKRLRNYGWPTTDTISEVVQNGCHVVYTQHRDCRNDGSQFRYSFSVAEVMLLRKCTQVQQIAYHLLRLFAKKELIQKDCPKKDEVICTYHLKTLMLWTCEEMSPQWWNSSSLIVICCELLKKLSDWQKRRYFPNYFIPQANLYHDSLSSTMLDKIERQLNKFCKSDSLCHWFKENYVQWFTGTQFKVLDCERYMQNLPEFRKTLQSELLDSFFSEKFRFCNLYNRKLYNPDAIQPRSILSHMHSLRTDAFLQDKCMSFLPMPADVSCFTYFDKTVYCLYTACSLGYGEISWDGDLFEYVKGLYCKSKIVGCQYHIFPEPVTAERSQQLFLRAQDLMENITGTNSPSEFQLLSLMSKEFLRKSLECDDSQSNMIGPAAFVYLAGLHFATAEYQIVIDLCSDVLVDQTIHMETETLNAGCLFFIDDVVRFVGFHLLCKKFNEKKNFTGRQFYLDLRLSIKVFAYYLTVASAERISKQFELDPDLPASAFPFDHYLNALAKRKSCILMKSCCCLKAARRCVYRRTESLTRNTTFSVNSLIATEKVIDYLTEYAFDNMISYYSVILNDCGIQCNTGDCYRALYLYKFRQYDEVLHLCEQILHEPDLQSDLENLAFANVLVMPPLDSFFDEDVRSLVGFHTLFYFLSPLYDDFRKFKFAGNIFGENVHIDSLRKHYTVTSFHFLGRHFLARYLKLRCYIDYNYPCEKALDEFAAMESRLPFEHIIRRFLLQRHRTIQK